MSNDNYTFKKAILQMYNKHIWTPSTALACPKCGVISIPNIEFKENNNSFKATCTECNSYIKFMGHDSIIYGGKK